MNVESKQIKDDCNNIFDNNFGNGETQLSNYNSLKFEKTEF